MNFKDKKLKLFLNYIEELTEQYEELLNQKKELLAELEKKALYDPLTKLFNRHALIEFLTKEIERIKREKGEKLFIIFLDLDNFKQVNDLYGHKKGDEVLKEVAQLLKTHFRKYDIVARFGGDEFMVVVRNRTKGEVENILKKLQERIEEIFKNFAISVSYGIAVAPDDGTDIDKLITMADRRMYKMKEKHKAKKLDN